jgi:hypothetical protein
MKRTEHTASPPRGSVRADELLTLSELRSRFGIGNKTVAQMRRSGLPIRRCGRLGFVLGSDLLAFFARLPSDGEEKSDGM